MKRKIAELTHEVKLADVQSQGGWLGGDTTQSSTEQKITCFMLVMLQASLEPEILLYTVLNMDPHI